MSPNGQRPGWWRRFRSLPARVQLATWAGLSVLVVILAIFSNGNGGGSTTTGVTTAETSAPPPTTVARTTTTLRAPLTTDRRTTTTTRPTTTTTRPRSTTTGRPTPPRANTAAAGLATLPVKGRAPMTGYSRERFGPAWTDDVSVADGHNRCDTRNDILRRDLTDIVLRPGTGGCIVERGVLHDPYTGTVILFTRGRSTSAAVQIDHVVSLGNAWQTGAQQLSFPVRTDLANDPLNLLATSGPANQQKGDSDAASWLPPRRAFRCTFVAIQVAVKIRYHLWVTPPEHAAIARVLSRCPNQPLPGGGPATTPATVAPPRPAPTTPTTRAPTPATAPPTTAPPATAPPATAPSAVPVVHPGAFCTPPGARGVTTRGTPMVCKLDSRGLRYRWGRA